VDPYSVLELHPGATPREVAAAYRRLAKRVHPDVAPGPEAAARMAELNAAYEQLKAGAPSGPGRPAAPMREPAPAPRRRAGWWLQPATRSRLAPEILTALEELESVHLVTPAWTRSSPETTLVVTDRRLLWLNDDKVLQRVRSLRYARVRELSHRLTRPRRRTAVLTVKTDMASHSFRGLPPAVAQGIQDYVAARTAAHRSGSAPD
jgi:hypothetical protein